MVRASCVLAALPLDEVVKAATRVSPDERAVLKALAERADEWDGCSFGHVAELGRASGLAPKRAESVLGSLQLRGLVAVKGGKAGALSVVVLRPAS